MNSIGGSQDLRSAKAVSDEAIKTDEMTRALVNLRPLIELGLYLSPCRVSKLMASDLKSRAGST